MNISADTAPAAAGSAFKFEGAAYAWFVVGALCVTNVVSYLERYMLTLMYEPIKLDFHISDTQVALLSTSFAIFSAVFGVYFGRLADRKNRKWLISIGVVAWSIATLACGLTRNFIQLFIARICVGVGEATLNPSAVSLIADYFPRERLTRALSFYSGSVAMGAGLALFLGGAVIHLVDQFSPLVLPGFGALRTWQATFLLVGLVGSLVIIPMAFVREPVRKGLLDTSAAARKKGLPLRDVVAYMAKHWKFYSAYLVGFGLANMVGMAVMSWTPSFFIRVHGWTPLEVGSFYGVTLSLVGTVSILLGARVSEWMDARGYTDTNMRLPGIAFFVAIIPSVLAYLMPSGGLSAVFLIVTQIISGLATAPMMAALQLITPNEMRGQMMSIFVLVASVFGSGLGPLIVALFTDYVFADDLAIGWSLISIILIVKPIVFAIFMWGLRPYREGLKEAGARARNVAAEGQPHF